MGDTAISTQTASSANPARRSPWAWVPSLYFAEGIPYVLVMTVSVVMYKMLGISNRDIAVYTSLLYLPWVIKPLWGPLVDLYWTKRRWVVLLQFLMGIEFAIMAVALQTPGWWVASLAVFTCAAFSSATHDIAADGFYMLGLDSGRQAYFVGYRGTFYRLAVIFGSGLLPIAVGSIVAFTGPDPVSIDLRGMPADSAPLAKVREVVQPKDPFVIATPASLSLAPGTTQSVELRLAAAPQTTMVLTVSRKAAHWYTALFSVGDGMKLTGGERIEVGPDNWQTPRKMVAEADAKLKQSVQSVWTVASGNIGLSWASAFGAIGVLFVVLSVWHRWAMPKPASDGHGGGDRPPFFYAASWMLATVAVPVVVLVALYYGFEFWGGSLASKCKIENLPLAATGVALAIAATFCTLLFGLAAKMAASPDGSSATSRPAFTAFQKASFAIAAMLLLVALSIGCRPIVELWAAQAFPKIKFASDVLLFASQLLIILVAWMFVGTSVAGWYAIAAFRGAARRCRLPFDEAFISFFRKPQVGRMIAFLLLYRLGEAMLIKLSGPFLLDTTTNGGLNLSPEKYGVAYGVGGVLALMAGGILGGEFASRFGLKKVILFMCLMLNAPHLLYVLLSYFRPENTAIVYVCVAGEQFGYGFGFAAYMIYMLFIAGEGEHKTSHFAITTGFMALSMMLPGYVSGSIYEACRTPGFKTWLLGTGIPESVAQATLGYPAFFLIVIAAAIPGLLILAFIPLNPEFGKKKKEAPAQ